MATKKTAKKTPAKAGAKPPDKPLQFLQNPDEYKRVVESQRQFAHEIAHKIEAGDTLEPMARDFAAVVLRHWADKVLSDKPKGKQGPPPKFDPAAEAMLFAAHRGLKGDAQKDIIASIADRVGVSEEAVRKGILPYRKAAFEFAGVPDPDNQK